MELLPTPWAPHEGNETMKRMVMWQHRRKPICDKVNTDSLGQEIMQPEDRGEK